MSKISFVKRLVILLIGVLFVVMMSAFIVNKSLQSIVKEISEESQPDERLVLLKGMMFDISDAENSVKSFGLTQNELYLDEYNVQIKEVNNKIDLLKQEIIQGSELEKGLPKIDSLVSKKFKVLDELLMVQSQGSSDLLLDKVIEEVDEVGVQEKIETVNGVSKDVEIDSKSDQQKTKFFKRLFGNRKKNENNELIDNVEVENDANAIDKSIEKIDRALEKLRREESKFEIELKLMELALIQEDKRIMDEISMIVTSLEEAEKKGMDQKIQMADENRKSTRLYIGVFCLLTCVLLVFAGYVVYSYVKKNDAYKKALMAAKNESDLKNKEITSSIKYAKRIQAAIMPEESKIKAFFPNSFIYYKPKDIVAGDFYWMIEMDDAVFIAVADCTGHGVPGAMVSVACSGALNRSVKEFGLREPAKILDKCRELVIETFEEGSKELFDGMDICLCKVDVENRKIQFAGANNSLYIVKNKELREVKADKQPIARFYKTKPFTNHNLQLEKGESIYLFTDGFPDQFGGDRKKKYLYKNFKELLAKNSDKNLTVQLLELDAELNSWKGNLEQVDDICIIGIQL